MQYNDRPYRTFVHEGQVFTVINYSEVDSLPGIWIDEPEFNLWSRECRKALWAAHRNPELAYMLRQSRVESAFLARLHCDPAHLPITRVQMKDYVGYSLTRETVGAWRVIEDSLIKVAEYLIDEANPSPEARFPFDAFWANPRSYNYDAVHRTLQGVRDSAQKARDALQVLTARVSMAIALIPNQPNSWEPGWVEVLRRRGVMRAWIDDLRDSPLCDFSPGTRAGAYIWPLPDGTKWMLHVPCMIRSNLPVYIRWPESTPGVPDLAVASKIVNQFPFLMPYQPVMAEAILVPEPIPSITRPARRTFRWDRLIRPHVIPAQQPPPPPLPRGDGQEPGETIWTFLARRDKEDHRRPETEAQRQARENRARSAAQKGPPGRKSGATFFLWLTLGEVDYTAPNDIHDLPIRKNITRTEAITRWEEFSNEQKVYNAYRNEWDICEDLGAPPADEDFEDLPVLPGPFVIPDTSTTSSFEQHLALFYGVEEKTSYQPQFDAFEEISWARYGIIPSVVADAGLDYEKYHKGKTLRYFGQPGDAAAPDNVIKAACAFVVALEDHPDGALRVPALISDMNPESQFWIGVAPWMHPTLQVSRITLEDDTQYTISYRDEELEWMIVTDARSAIELVRRHGITGCPAAAQYLAQRGSRFQTLQHEDRRCKFEGRTPPQAGLGRRDFEFGKYAAAPEYRAYEERARALLTRPRGRAALLRGGIIWRLAMELLGTDGITRAAAGPSEECHIYGHEFSVPSREDPFYDDHLTPDELSLIAGVYIVPNRTYR